ncbi:nucleoside phosphatase family-domain-containing protein [Kockovaella imperatae]|uniref:Nucleoside phosphatase family-domain-containing protein n=1 Tax=Kockovaella imperatae TaxID=4999 RepID=A0A1Y1UPW6_9TREE|nr:nucleoside phosphatase family-domain-containing protein [Kockovaella imperatae]ORX39185.1 nucleoside phosphatase family-domain-containing protein [Kockovaella imperatae]
MAPSVTPKHTHYALVVDAGSSGSRLQIYSWRDPDLERAEILQEVQLARKGKGGKKWWFDSLPSTWKGKGKAREDQVETTALRRLVRVGKGVEGDAWVKKVEPGISTIPPEDIPSYLAPLLSHALQQIPPSQHSATPIYVLATAGMRLLSDSARDAILEATCQTLRSKYPFKLDSTTCRENVRVITGEEEGMWGWVAVNYLMDGFGHAPEPTHTLGASSSSTSGLLPLAPLAEPPPRSSTASVTPVDVSHQSPTFGFLDMGGASTQLAFSPSSIELARSGFPASDLHDISLRLLSGEDVHWPLFVASWLGYGTNKVRDRYLDNLLARARSDGALDKPIPDPCLPKDFVDTMSEVSFKGTGQFATCLTDLRPLLQHDLPCPTRHCLFGGVSTPFIDFEREDQRGFIGISEYWYTTQQVLGLGGVFDWGEWEKGMGEFCSREWSSIEKQVESEKGWGGAAVELSRLQMQCFKGAWISNVLHEGIGIPRLVDAGGNDTLTGGSVGDTNAEAERRAREKGLAEKVKGKHHFQSMDEVGETAISWTLGKMVIEASKQVPPRSAAVEAAWTSRLPQIHLSELENRLNRLGIQTVWAYTFMTFLLVICIFNMLRRRLRWSLSSTRSARFRKPSISDGRSVWPWRGNVEEEGIDLTPSKSSFRGSIGRFHLWTMRLGSILRRNNPFGPNERNARAPFGRSVSMPLTATLASGDWTPPLPSPRGGGQFFTPGYGVPNDPTSSQTTSSSTSTAIGSKSGAASPVTASPPRSKSFRGKARPSLPSNLALHVPDTNNGWNDPPTSMLNGATYAVDPEEVSPTGSTSGVLTPMANARGLDVNSRPMSRQSSRVNLSELGLAQRGSSRSTTPMRD